MAESRKIIEVDNNPNCARANYMGSQETPQRLIVFGDKTVKIDQVTHGPLASKKLLDAGIGEDPGNEILAQVGVI